MDYGNEDSVKFQYILASSSQIPPGQEDFIDENVELENFASQPAVLVAKSVAVESKSEEKKGVVEKKKVEKVVEKKVEKVVEKKVEKVVEKKKVEKVVEKKKVEKVVNEKKLEEMKSVEKKKLDEKKRSAGSPQVWKEGAACVARWSEDSVWYRAEVLSVSPSFCLVKFVDYGNEEEVALQYILKTSAEIPAGESIDEFVTGQFEDPDPEKDGGIPSKEVRSEPSHSVSGGESVNTTTSSGIGDSINTTFFSFIEKDSKGDFTSLTLKKKVVFNVNTPAGVSVLADGSVAIVSRMSDSVKLFSRTGSPLRCPLEGHRKFERPTNILRLANGKIVIRDTK